MGDSVPGMEYVDWGPTRRSLTEGEPCPECDYPFDSDEWNVRHLTGGPSLGESWIYTCPECEQETCSVGT